MRRNLPAILLLVALLTIGGLVIYNNFNAEVSRPFFGYPLTPLNSDPTAAQTQALILVIGGGALVGGMVVMGAVLAFAVQSYSAFERTRPASAAAPASPAKSAAKPEGGPSIPLSNQRSLAVFWIVLIVLFVGFMVIRNWGVDFGYLPLAQLAQIGVFRLPGQHIDGLPAWIAGPGDMLNALQLLIGALGFAVVGTVVTGVALALGAVRIDQTLKVADKMPRTALDRALAFFLYFGKPPAELKGPPARPLPFVERILLGLDVVLIVVILVAVGVWAVPILTAPTARAGGATTAAAGNPLEAELAALPAGHADAGGAVFDAAGAGGCGACHSLQPDQRIVGPSLAGVATRAATHRAGYSAELYLYESMVSPNAYVAETFQPDLMPKDFKTRLTAQQQADVIAFLMTQK